jgi:transcription antitermination factor NusG
MELAAARCIDGPLGRAFTPMVRRNWLVRNQRRMALSPVLAGYTFVEIERGDAYRWHEIAAIAGFVGGADPEPIRKGVVERMIAGADPETWEVVFEPPPEVLPKLKRGDLVVVRSGAFQDMRGVVEWEENSRRIHCRLEGLFGREMRAAIDVDLLDELERPRHRRTYNLMNLPVRQAAA